MIDRRSFTLGAAATGLMATFSVRAQPASIDAYPGAAVRITNPFPAGSGPDVVSRWIGERLSKTWNQPVVIHNRPGSSGFVALQSVKQVPANGHDLFLAAADHMAINPALFKKLPYSPSADFVPVSGLYRTSFLVLVSASGPIRTVPELVAYARSGENKATYGSQAVGSPLHLGGAQIEAAIQARMLHVPFKETSALYQSVANGEVTWALGSLGSAGALIQAGRLRVLAVADTQRSAAMPDVPTLADAGGPPVSVPTWVALFAPAGTPPLVVNRIRESVHAALDTPDLRNKLMGFGFLPAKASGAEVGEWIRTDQLHYAALVKQTGATVD
jgi:tripartite-type tricarboxylate transporter receptor subunit TctC